MPTDTSQLAVGMMPARASRLFSRHVEVSTGGATGIHRVKLGGEGLTNSGSLLSANVLHMG